MFRRILFVTFRKNVYSLYEYIRIYTNMNCYICLESTDTIAEQDCKCLVYTHQSCYEEWLQHKEVCLICKKSIYDSHRPNFSSFIMGTIDHFIDSFMYDRMNGFHFIIFLLLSFMVTILLITPMCMFKALTKNQFRKIRFARRTAC